MTALATVSPSGRRCLASQPIGLGTHIQDIVSLLELEELSDVVLTGHGYSGIVVTGAADRAADRVGLVV